MDKNSIPIPHALTVCINCGAHDMHRRNITVALRHPPRSITVMADVCGNCGEPYFDSAAMRRLLPRRREEMTA